MTKPSDFIFNSDYLALAETGRRSLVLSVPPMTYTQSAGFDSTTLWSATLNCPVGDSSVESFQITYNGKTYTTNSIYSLAPWKIIWPALTEDAHWIMEVFRKDRDTLQANFVFIPEWESQGDMTPLINLQIDVCSFKPPNVF